MYSETLPLEGIQRLVSYAREGTLLKKENLPQVCYDAHDVLGFCLGKFVGVPSTALQFGSGYLPDAATTPVIVRLTDNDISELASLEPIGNLQFQKGAGITEEDIVTATFPVTGEVAAINPVQIIQIVTLIYNLLKGWKVIKN